jgi:hypothetical protein
LPMRLAFFLIKEEGRYCDSQDCRFRQSEPTSSENALPIVEAAASRLNEIHFCMNHASMGRNSSGEKKENERKAVNRWR